MTSPHAEKSGCRWKSDVRHYLYICLLWKTTSQQDSVTTAQPFFLLAETLSVSMFIFVSTQRIVLKHLQGT